MILGAWIPVIALFVLYTGTTHSFRDAAPVTQIIPRDANALSGTFRALLAHGTFALADTSSVGATIAHRAIFSVIARIIVIDRAAAEGRIAAVGGAGILIVTRGGLRLMQAASCFTTIHGASDAIVSTGFGIGAEDATFVRLTAIGGADILVVTDRRLTGNTLSRLEVAGLCPVANALVITFEVSEAPLTGLFVCNAFPSLFTDEGKIRWTNATLRSVANSGFRALSIFRPVLAGPFLTLVNGAGDAVIGAGLGVLLPHAFPLGTKLIGTEVAIISTICGLQAFRAFFGRETGLCFLATRLAAGTTTFTGRWRTSLCWGTDDGIAGPALLPSAPVANGAKIPILTTRFIRLLLTLSPVAHIIRTNISVVTLGIGHTLSTIVF